MNWMKIFGRKGSSKKSARPSLTDQDASETCADKKSHLQVLETEIKKQEPSEVKHVDDGQAPDVAWSKGSRSTTTTPTVFISTTTTDPGLLTDEEREDKAKEAALLDAWRRNTKPKMLPIPSDYPDYMRDSPNLKYAETDASLRRKQYNMQRMKMIKSRNLPKPVRPSKPLREGPTPKSNRSSDLRKGYSKKKPILSQHFEHHFETFHRAPFKNIAKMNSCKT